MKKFYYIGFILLLFTVVVFGCSDFSKKKDDRASSKPVKSIETETPNGYAKHKITFPVSAKGQTEYNKKIFEIKPFDLSFILPDGWIIKEAETEEVGIELRYLNDSAWSIMDVYNDANECVGAVGYNIYELYDGAEYDPQSIYNQIALGNGYRFDAKEQYQPVNTTDASCTAITDVLYSPAFIEGKGFERVDKVNKGILSYWKNELVYVAAEFDKDALVDKQLLTIAQSFNFSCS